VEAERNIKSVVWIRVNKMLINIPNLKEQCQKFIKNNPQLKISKFVEKKGTFVFYRKYTPWKSKEEYESADFRIIIVRTEKKEEGWSIDFMRHTGKWTLLPIFGSFDTCLNEIKSGKWWMLMPM